MAAKKKITAKVASDAIEAVKNVDLKSELNAIADAQLAVQNQLSGLGSLVSDRVNRVAELDTAILAKKEELAELFALGEALADKEAVLSETASLEEELVDRKVRADREHKQAEEDYAADFARRKRNLEAELKDARQLHDKELTAKTLALVEREKVLAALQAQVDNIPKTVDAEVKKEVAIATNSLKRDYEHRTALSDLEAKNNLSLVQSQLSSANSRVAELTARVAELNAEVMNIRRDSNEVIKSFAESNSGKAALEAVQSMQRNETVSKK